MKNPRTGIDSGVSDLLSEELGISDPATFPSTLIILFRLI